MGDIVIEVRELSKRYHRGAEQPLSVAEVFLGALRNLRDQDPHDPSGFWALDRVSFDVRNGERIGIIGPNGAGKTTLLKVLSRIVYPTRGEARVRGRVASLIGVGTGFNPLLSGRENIFLNAAAHGLDRSETLAKYDDIVEFSGVREFIETPVRHYSSGMYMRLAFAVAAHLEPDILLMDEVLAVGDLSFQEKCLKRVENLTSEGRTVLFVSHSPEAVLRFCERCIWLDHGRIRLDGPTVEVTEAYIEQMMAVQSSRTFSPTAEDTAHDLEPKHSDGTSAGADQAHQNDPPLPTTVVAADGEDLVQLVSARVIDEAGHLVTSVEVDRGFGIEVVFDVLRKSKIVQPALHFKTPRDEIGFVVAYTDPEHMRRVPEPGRYATVAWIPPNLLNIGVMHVTVTMVTPDPLERHCTAERAVSFNVYERQERMEQSARGLYAREFPGHVRPLLRWQTRGIETATETSPPAVGARPVRSAG